jgi:hypothetical protein
MWKLARWQLGIVNARLIDTQLPLPHNDRCIKWVGMSYVMKDDTQATLDSLTPRRHVSMYDNDFWNSTEQLITRQCRPVGPP